LHWPLPLAFGERPAPSSALEEEKEEEEEVVVVVVEEEEEEEELYVRLETRKACGN
jgi:hypothetical protein